MRRCSQIVLNGANNLKRITVTKKANKKRELFSSEKKAIKATQVAFDISTEAQKRLKLKAIHNDLSPSDQMRAILGLPCKKPVRPRLTISLSEEDYILLAEKYAVNLEDKLKIKEKAAQTIIDDVMKEDK
ncbi:hypothetical protein [Aliikangiella sp. G2MR2-5]|uniref:hypothetical protein n=1 Tax=Aliikangiella sp. G2MR2-5 TaxID=2788943 RepID=UPI001AEF203A|nr:hypothetical protein [Aliikangiella sp. G2MR2-5]